MSFSYPNKIDNTDLLKLGMVVCALSDSKTDFLTDTYNMDNKQTKIKLYNIENKVFGEDKGYVVFWGSKLILNNYEPSAYNSGIASSNNKPNLTHLDQNNPNQEIDSNVSVLDTKITLDLPNNITANCKSGDTLPTGFKILLQGDMKAGDSVTLSRSGKEDAILTIPNDCNFAGLNYNMDYKEVKVKYGNGADQPQEENKPIKATYNLSNCTSNITDDKLAEGTHSFIITPNSGYMFTGEQSYSYDNPYTFTDIKETIDFDDPKKPITFDVKIPEGSTRLYLNFNAKQIPPEENKPIKATYNLSNCTSNITDDKLAEGTHSFIITPNSGYMFTGEQSYSYKSPYTGAEIQEKIDVDDPKKPIAFDVKLSEGTTYLYLNFNATQIPPDESNTPTQFTHVYNPSDSDLAKLTTDMITIVGDDGTPAILDIGAYITSLYNLPYAIDESLIGEKEFIKLANKKSNVKTPTILGNNFTVDLGTIKVNEEYKSNFDYSNTQCFLVCPYMDRISLQIDDVIEHTLKLKFIINIYNGDCTLLVSSDDRLIYNSTFKIANKIPYTQNYVDNSNKNNTDNVIFNDVNTAYIEIIRPKALENNVVSTDEIGKLKDYQGFTSIRNLSLNTNASLSEQQEIELKLQSGVYINE